MSDRRRLAAAGLLLLCAAAALAPVVLCDGASVEPSRDSPRAAARVDSPPPAALGAPSTPAAALVTTASTTAEPAASVETSAEAPLPDETLDPPIAPDTLLKMVEEARRVKLARVRGVVVDDAGERRPAARVRTTETPLQEVVSGPGGEFVVDGVAGDVVYAEVETLGGRLAGHGRVAAREDGALEVQVVLSFRLSIEVAWEPELVRGELRFGEGHERTWSEVTSRMDLPALVAWTGALPVVVVGRGADGAVWSGRAVVTTERPRARLVLRRLPLLRVRVRTASGGAPGVTRISVASAADGAVRWSEAPPRSGALDFSERRGEPPRVAGEDTDAQGLVTLAVSPGRWAFRALPWDPTVGASATAEIDVLEGASLVPVELALPASAPAEVELDRSLAGYEVRVDAPPGAWLEPVPGAVGEAPRRLRVLGLGPGQAARVLVVAQGDDADAELPPLGGMVKVRSGERAALAVAPLCRVLVELGPDAPVLDVSARLEPLAPSWWTLGDELQQGTDEDEDGSEGEAEGEGQDEGEEEDEPDRRPLAPPGPGMSFVTEALGAAGLAQASVQDGGLAELWLVPGAYDVTPDGGAIDFAPVRVEVPVGATTLRVALPLTPARR